MNGQGLGFRVPGLVISPYARRGYIDHQVLSTDSYLRFIEDDFLGGQRIDPATDGRPDSRPFVAEDAPGLGDLSADFNFAPGTSTGVAASAPPRSGARSARADHTAVDLDGHPLDPVHEVGSDALDRPASSIDRRRGSSSWNRIFVSSRARWAPRQKCGPPGPNVTWSFGVRVTSNR